MRRGGHGDGGGGSRGDAGRVRAPARGGGGRTPCGALGLMDVGLAGRLRLPWARGVRESGVGSCVN